MKKTIKQYYSKKLEHKICLVLLYNNNALVNTKKKYRYINSVI